MSYEFRCKRHLARPLGWNDDRSGLGCMEKGCESQVTADEQERLEASSDVGVFVDRLDRRGVAVYRMRPGGMAPVRITPSVRADRMDEARPVELDRRAEPSVLDELPSFEEVTAEIDATIARLGQLLTLQGALFRNDVERVRQLAEPLWRAKQEEARRTLAKGTTGG